MNRVSPLLVLEGVSKTFHTDEVETRALDQISLTINKGEYVSICGPSGCGKSTLLSILGLLDSPSSGAYSISGVSIAEIDNKERTRVRNKEIGFIFQSFNLIGDLTVVENVELPLNYRRGVSSTLARSKSLDALDRVGMSHRARHYPSQLSGGQQQRVAVARALAGSPSLLLADEPTGNLDSTNGDSVLELLGRLHKDGSTICMVTHDQRYADLSERKILMSDGRVVSEMTMEGGAVDSR